MLHADAGIAWHAGVLPPIHCSATFKADDVADFADGLRRRHRVRKCAATSRPRAFVSSFQLPTHAFSLGGVETLIVHTAAMWSSTMNESQMRAAGIAPNFERLAVGLAHPGTGRRIRAAVGTIG